MYRRLFFIRAREVATIRHAGITSRAWAVLALSAALAISPARAQSTAFTYQGRLEASGVPADGAYDFCFRLFTDLFAGKQVGSTICAINVEVVNGLFTVDLNFGQQFANSEDRYLEIEVCPNVDGSSCAATAGNATSGIGFVTLQPRQRITATPLASHANAAFALDAPDGSPGGAVFVDNAGKVGIGTTAPTHTVHVASPAPTLALQDTDSNTQQVGYISYRDSGNTERAWVGYGSADNPHFSIVNARSGGNIALLPFSGSVGIGTSSPAAKLDVRGDIRLGPSGQFRAASGEENLRIVRGLVDLNGNVVRGSGFTAVRDSMGKYTITFTTPFAGSPDVCATAEYTPSDGAQYVSVDNVTASVAHVVGFSADHFLDDVNFHFIAVGPQ